MKMTRNVSIELGYSVRRIINALITGSSYVLQANRVRYAWCMCMVRLSSRVKYIVGSSIAALDY